MKVIIFKHSRGFSNDVYEEEIEFDEDATEQEINDAYIEWILEKVGDDFTWYEKE